MLKEVRQQRKLTQRELAKKTNVSVRMIQYYEQGRANINNAQTNTVIKLAKALNCPITDILTNHELIEMYESIAHARSIAQK